MEKFETTGRRFIRAVVITAATAVMLLILVATVAEDRRQAEQFRGLVWDLEGTDSTAAKIEQEAKRLKDATQNTEPIVVTKPIEASKLFKTEAPGWFTSKPSIVTVHPTKGTVSPISNGMATICADVAPLKCWQVEAKVKMPKPPLPKNTGSV